MRRMKMNTNVLKKMITVAGMALVLPGTVMADNDKKNKTLGMATEQGISTTESKSSEDDVVHETPEFEHAKMSEHATEMYLNGIQCEKKNMNDDALKWYKVAILGNSDAMCKLACCYKQGKGAKQSDEKAFELFQQAAERGNTDAKYELACCYKYGKGVEQNDGKAFELYQQAAEKGNIDAMCKVAQCYKCGDGVEWNIVKAFEWYEVAAKAGNAEAICNLAYCYRYGRGVKADRDKGIELFQKAAAQGNPKAMVELFNYGIFNEFEWIAFDQYEKLAQTGDTYAMRKVAKCYIDGIGVKTDRDKRLKLLQQAAEKGDKVAETELPNLNDDMQKKLHEAIEKRYKELAESGCPEAMHELGNIYFRQGGRPRTRRPRTLPMSEVISEEKRAEYFSMAIEWFQKAVNNGCERAICSLADCYNGDEKIKILREAADSGNKDAMYVLANEYTFGKNIEKSDSKAFEWYMKAAKVGHVNSMSRLVSYYSGRRDVPRDANERVFWLRELTKKGDLASMRELASCYEKGDGVEQNYEKAFEWYMKSAVAGSEIAMCKVASFYEEGKGVKKDFHKAEEWYQRSVDVSNDTEPVYRLGRLYCYWNGVEKNIDKGVKLLQLAVKNGNIQAADRLFEICKDDKMLDPDVMFKMYWIKAQEISDTNVMYKLAECYKNGIGVDQSDESAFTWYLKAANCGNVDAMNCIGDCYMFGEGVSQDFDKASEWYEKADI